jgi:hypothetical protein
VVQLVNLTLSSYSGTRLNYAVAIAKALQEFGVIGMDDTNPGYEEVTGLVKLRMAEGGVKPVHGAPLTFAGASLLF